MGPKECVSEMDLVHWGYSVSYLDAVFVADEFAQQIE